MYSYEQIICAMLANYKNTIALGEINKVIMAFKERRPDFGIIIQNITYIKKYIEFNKHFITLKGNLEETVNYDGVIMSLREYFNMIAGEELVSFIEEYSNGHTAKRN